MLHADRFPSPGGASRNALIVVCVVALHIAGLWALQSGLLRRAAQIIVPAELLSNFIAPPAPEAAPPPPPPAPPAPRPKAQAPRPAPMPVTLPAPHPTSSRPRGEQGTVLLRVLIGSDALPQKVEINQSSGFDRLDRQAQEAVMRWRFVPGKRNGVAEAMWNLVPVNFVLE